MWVAYEKLVKLRSEADPLKYFNDKNPNIRDMNEKIHLVLNQRLESSPKAQMKSPGPFSNPKTPIQQYHDAYKENHTGIGVIEEMEGGENDHLQKTPMGTFTTPTANTNAQL